MPLAGHIRDAVPYIGALYLCGSFAWPKALQE